MKLERIIEQVFLKPWAILPAKHRAIQAALEAHLNGATCPALPEPEQEHKVYDVVGKVAVIPIEGVILNKCSTLEAMCGAFSLETFKRTLKEAAARPDVESIILNISSGGGTVTGVPEAADLIKEVAKTKPVYAYTNDCIASAAYWLASQCSGVFLSKSAEIGSIGVYLALIDESQAWAMNGLKLELFKAGDYKATGIPGKPFTDAEKAMLQASVDKCYNQFVSYVTSKRKVTSETVQGQMFDAEEAISNKLADGIISDLDAFIDYLNAA